MPTTNIAKTIRPTVGFAFSGASSRSIFYIGFLEVLSENDFPIDFIAAMSGGAIVASSYACNTLPQLKKMALGMDKELVFNIIERSKGRGGLYQLTKFEEFIRLYTRNQKFENVHPRLGFVTTDVSAGEEVVLQVGDIARAVSASCTLPGIFQPFEWGNRQLIDGGIMNIVPGNVARESNVDIVIGIDMRATRHIFSPWQIFLKKVLNFTRQLLWPNKFDRVWQKFLNSFDYIDFFNSYPTIDDLPQKSIPPNLFSVLGKSLDLAITAQKKQRDEKFDCDLLIVPEITHLQSWKKYLFLHFTDFSNSHTYYQAGRTTAEQHLPTLWQMLADKEAEIAEKDRTLETMLNSKYDGSIKSQ